MAAHEWNGPMYKVDIDPVVETLELFPYGLYIIGSRGADNINGMMADWLMQVSFKPRLVCLSLENNSTTLRFCREAGVFTVNLLPADGGAALAAAGATFVGNVEGRDLLVDTADVVVCDGFTGNVALKTLEGGMKTLVTALFGVFETDEQTKAAADVLLPHLLPLYGALDPNNTGGALLLGVDGPCIISHGSSNATAVANALGVAADAVERDLVGALRTGVGR